MLLLMSTTQEDRSPATAGSPREPERHRARRRSTGTAAAGVAVLLALAAAGCGGGGDDPATTAAASGSEGAGQSTTPATVTNVPAAADATKPLDTRDGNIADEAVTVELLSLKRSGPTLVLSLRLRPTVPGRESRAQIASALSNEVFEKDPTTDDTIDSDNLDGITLVDTKNRKRHLVARDARNGCVCTTGLSSTFVTDAAPSNLSATFGAPPADVRALDVTIPRFGTFTGVPVS